MGLEALRELADFRHVRTQLEAAIHQEGSLTDTESAGALILDFPISRIIRNIFMLFINYPVYSSPNTLNR
jgi:hypothetical protein